MSRPQPPKSAIESHLRFAESFRVHGPISTSEFAVVSTPLPRNNSLCYTTRSSSEFTRTPFESTIAPSERTKSPSESAKTARFARKTAVLAVLAAYGGHPALRPRMPKGCPRPAQQPRRSAAKARAHDPANLGSFVSKQPANTAAHPLRTPAPATGATSSAPASATPADRSPASAPHSSARRTAAAQTAPEPARSATSFSGGNP